MTKAVLPPPPPSNWEMVGVWSNETHCLKIDGGWLYRYQPFHRDPCLVFVPDVMRVP